MLRDVRPSPDVAIAAIVDAVIRRLCASSSGGASRATFDKNVLLTTCQDNICRLWSETSMEESLRFFMCAFIDPQQLGVRAAPIYGSVPRTGRR